MLRWVGRGSVGCNKRRGETVDTEFDSDKTLDEGRLQWCIDNETGERVLIDKYANKIIGVHKKDQLCPLCGK